MTSNRKLFKNISYLSLAELASKGLQAVYIIYLANVITTKGFGIYGFSQSIVAIFLIAVSFGIDTYGNREVAKKPEKLNEYVNDILSLRFTLAVVCYIILVAFAFIINKGELVTLAILVLGLNLFSNALLLNWAFQGLEKMEAVAFRQVGVSLLNIVGIFLFVTSFEDTLTAIWIISLSTLINSILMIVYYVRNYGKIELNLNFEKWKPIIKKAIPIGAFTLVVVLFKNVDMTMLGFLRENFEHETGIYNAAFRVFVLAIVPSAIIQNSFFPQLSRSFKHESRDEILDKYTKLTYLIGAFIAVSAFIYADFGINLVFGDEYFESILIMKIFSLTILIAYLNVAFTIPMVAWNQEKKPFFASIAALCINISLNVYLIPNYGTTGAAVATVLSELALYVVISYYIYKSLGRLYLKNLFYALSISIFAGLPAYLYINDNLSNTIGILVTILLFILITHYSGFLNIFNYKNLFKK